MNTFSIIIPVYNCKDYLSSCVESILVQTYPDYEIILVDDGSTDGSGVLCDVLAQQDGRIRVIHKKNGGASSARNTGLDLACGRYLVFVDGDDTVEPDCLETVLLSMRNTDLAIYGMVFDTYSHGKLCRSQLLAHPHAEFLDRAQFGSQFYSLFLSNSLSSACNKCFCTETIQQNNLRFDEQLSIYEDFEFVLRYLQYVSSVYMLPQGLYHYRLQPQKYHNRVRDLALIDGQVTIIGQSLDLHGDTVSSEALSAIRYGILHQAVVEALITLSLSHRSFHGVLDVVKRLENYSFMLQAGGSGSLYAQLSQGQRGRIHAWALKARARRTFSKIKQKLLFKGRFR